ncbi:MAG TPA: glutathione S-transferase family protein [Allosphingosinicella sp.]|nr:glutathione S-transferase family protein [Allosphingosinicella sp.]
MKLHAHPLSSYCWKALIALYEKATPFDFEPLDFGDPEAAAEFAALWPMAKMPVLVDGERVIVETSIIIEYLDLFHPAPIRLVPEDRETAIEVRMLDRIFDNYVMTPMQKIVFNRFCPAEARNAHDVMTARRTIDTAFGWLEERLKGRTWAAGESFGLADCAAAPSLHYADKVQPMAGRFPGLADYLARLEARPSFARVLKEAEPYAHMFPKGDD